MSLPILHVYVSSTWLDLEPERRAVELYEQSLVIARAIGDRRGEGREQRRRAVSKMAWASIESSPARELFKGIRVSALWEGENGAKAQALEMEPGTCWEGLDVHEPGPEEVFVVSGVFNDGVRDYPAGSFIHAPAGSSHVPQSRTGCVLFLFYPEG